LADSDIHGSGLPNFGNDRLDEGGTSDRLHSNFWHFLSQLLSNTSKHTLIDSSIKNTGM
jgi:hypothetical protein